MNNDRHTFASFRIMFGKSFFTGGVEQITNKLEFVTKRFDRLGFNQPFFSEVTYNCGALKRLELSGTERVTKIKTINRVFKYLEPKVESIAELLTGFGLNSNIHRIEIIVVRETNLFDLKTRHTRTYKLSKKDGMVITKVHKETSKVFRQKSKR